MTISMYVMEDTVYRLLLIRVIFDRLMKSL